MKLPDSLFKTCLQLACITALLGCMLAVPLLLVLNADKFGVFWWIILLLYAGLLSGILWYVLNRRAMIEMHAYLGDEEFYKRFPREKKREERLKKLDNLIAWITFSKK